MVGIRRTHISQLRYRAGLEAGWMLEWHPILHYRRIDSFIEPHYCYRVQWRELLREEHTLWRIQSIVPHASYEGQWDRLCEVEYLPDAVLDSMIDQLMFEINEEGGPRCSCVDCFFKPATQLRASYRTPQGRPVMEDAMRVEGQIGFTMKQGTTLKSLLEEGIPKN